MLARTQSIGCAPPTRFLPCQARTLKTAGEVFPWRRLIVPFTSRSLRSGCGRAAASASETDVDVPDVTSAIEQSIQRAVERASAAELPDPESIPTFKEVAPAVPVPSPANVAAASPISSPPETPPVPEAIKEPLKEFTLKTPEVPKPVEIPKVVPDAPVASPVEPPAGAIEASVSPPELPSALADSPKLPEEGIPKEDVQAAADKIISSVKKGSGQSLQDAAGQSVSGVKKAAGQTLSGVQDAAGQTVSGVKKAAGQTLTGVQDAAGQTVSGVKKAAGQTVSNVQESVGKGVSGAKEAASKSLDSAVTGAKQAASNSLDSVFGAANDKAGEVKTIGTGAGKKLQGALTYGTDSINATYKNTLKGIGDSIVASKQAVQSNVITPVKSTAASAVDQVIGSIPPEVKDTVGATVRPVVNHPVASLLALTTMAGIYAAISFKNRFSYKAPTITPFEALGLLEASEDPALLVDLRPEEERLEMGIPRLRKKAFGKGAAVEAYRLPPRLATRVRNQTQAEAAITAVYIGGQQKASMVTKFILMGSQSEDYKSIVDALRASGFSQVAVVDGGFASWVSAGLPVNTSPVATYEPGTLDAITEFAQVIADGLAPLDGPYAYAKYSAGLAATVWTVLNYAFVLQMVGVIGPLVSGTVIFINDYDSPGDFFKELSQSLPKNGESASGEEENSQGKGKEQKLEKEKATSKSVNGDPGTA
ncbi:hypothetical protein BSKO_08679 [Bryopsis sp. KO-2023]|nr:hypothetical protein BSKO_08679 [Bryopsis sp. KO-2023]